MTTRGSLGFPKRRIDPIGDLSPKFQSRLFLEYHTLLSTQDLAKQKLCEMKNDTRTAIPRIDQKSYITNLTMWWLWRANETSTQQADAELEDYLSSDSIKKIMALWIFGTEVSKTISITEDINIISPNEIPDSDDKEFLLNIRSSELISQSVKPSAALVASFIEPKHWTTEDMPDALADRIDKFRRISEAALLLNCMPGACSIPGYQTEYCIASVPPGPFSGSGGGKSVRDIVALQSSQLDFVDKDNFKNLLSGYSKLDGTWTVRAIRAIHRLSQSKARSDYADKLLDLGIALEMVLLSSNHGGGLPGQLHNHFRLRGAWLLGKDLQQRKKLYADLGKIYTLRSQVAHSGTAKDLGKMTADEQCEKINLYTNLAEEILRKIIIDGPPDWSNLVLGSQG